MGRPLGLTARRSKIVVSCIIVGFFSNITVDPGNRSLFNNQCHVSANSKAQNAVKTESFCNTKLNLDVCAVLFAK